MFITKDEIKQQINSIIDDDINNDVVFIIANKGFGKYKLLSEVYNNDFQMNIIVVNGENFHCDSIIKNCLIHGIYEYLRRHNSIPQRKRLFKIIRQKRAIPIRDRILVEFHIKLKPGEVEDLLKVLSIDELKSIYKIFSDNAPLVFFIRGTDLSDSDSLYLSKLKVERSAEKFTYIVALRPNRFGIELIRNVVQAKDEGIWICPLLPTVKEKSSDDMTKIETPIIALDHIKEGISYTEFKAEIAKKDYYIPVFELVDDLLSSGIKPSMIFTITNQELNRVDFDYINSLTVRLLHEPRATVNNYALITHGGKYMWVDALAYYMVVNESIEELILEMQRFYFAFLLEISKWEEVADNPFLFELNTFETRKGERKRMNKFLKDMSEIAENPLAPKLTAYTSKLSDWVRVFSRPAITDKVNFSDVDVLVDDLYSFYIGFSDVNIEALEIINNVTGRLGSLDIGLQVIANELRSKPSFSKQERDCINKFIKHCLEQAIKWSDVTLGNEICMVLQLCEKCGILESYCISSITCNHGMYHDLKQILKGKNIKIGDVILGRTTIFISYTRADQVVVNVIDDYLRSCGYDVKRDIRDIGDYESIDEFMKGIRKQDYVVPIISDTYLRRNNCIYEISQLLKDASFKHRTLPVIIDLSKSDGRAYGFFDNQYMAEITKYWEDEAENLHTVIKGIGLENTVELNVEYRKIKNFAQIIAEFLAFAKGIKAFVISSDAKTAKKKQKAREAAIKIDELICKNVMGTSY